MNFKAGFYLNCPNKSDYLCLTHKDISRQLIFVYGSLDNRYTRFVYMQIQRNLNVQKWHWQKQKEKRCICKILFSFLFFVCENVYIYTKMYIKMRGSRIEYPLIELIIPYAWQYWLFAKGNRRMMILTK